MRFGRHILALGVLLPLPLHAFFGCDNMGQFSIDAEWLYLRPSIDTNLFVSTDFSTIVEDQEFLSNVPAYHSGWRVGASYSFCNCVDEISVRWTQLRTTDRHTANTTDVFLPNGRELIGAAVNKDTLHFSYHAFDALLNHQLYADCGFTVDLIAGGQYAWIHVKEKINSTSATESIVSTQLGRVWGIGPELGLDFNYTLCGCFSFVGRGTGALLVSRCHDSIESTATALTPPLRRVGSTPLWRVAPTWDMRLGLRFDSCCGCGWFYVEGGYEVISYHRALRLDQETNTGSNTLTYSNADMHGPYVAVGCTF